MSLIYLRLQAETMPELIEAFQTFFSKAWPAQPMLAMSLVFSEILYQMMRIGEICIYITFYNIRNYIRQ